MAEGDILRVNPRWYPFLHDGGPAKEGVYFLTVLVEGLAGNYAAYSGIAPSNDEYQQGLVARFGEKNSFAEAQIHFPAGLERGKYHDE